jgi:hypothetical protein
MACQRVYVVAEVEVLLAEHGVRSVVTEAVGPVEGVVEAELGLEQDMERTAMMVTIVIITGDQEGAAEPREVAQEAEALLRLPGAEVVPLLQVGQH